MLGGSSGRGITRVRGIFLPFRLILRLVIGVGQAEASNHENHEHDASNAGQQVSRTEWQPIIQGSWRGECRTGPDQKK
ncbi:MAG TPA: hypothetical protein DCR55_01285 [Lentisphaeria bacterium]|nr:hypothetical protein [Lentisphaeria bacterium]